MRRRSSVAPFGPPSPTSPGFVLQVDAVPNGEEEDLLRPSQSSKGGHEQGQMRLPSTRRALGGRNQNKVLWGILLLNAFILFQHRGQLHTVFYPPPITGLVQHGAIYNSSNILAYSAPKHPTKGSIATSSCELCIINPQDELCEYGLDQIRLSRGYEGSGFRIRRFLEKAIAGQEVKVGIIGASVSLGHGVSWKGLPTWWEVLFKDFKKAFPKAKISTGLVGGTNSQFHSYCFPTIIPTDLDLYLVELDINNDPNEWTVRHDDALHRALLGLPQEPAVVRISVMMLIASELARGATSALLTSQFFDIPVITMRNAFLPYYMQHPEHIPQHFTTYENGETDLRHISELGHQYLGDMVALYFREQTCETRRRMATPAVAPKPDTTWPQDDILGRIPRLQLWNGYSKDFQASAIMPTCQFAGSTTHPMRISPMPSTTPPTSSLPTSAPAGLKDWVMIAWNDKSAYSSRTVGAQIVFDFEGVDIGIFSWETRKVGNAEGPGKITCWIDDEREKATQRDCMSGREFPGSEWTSLFEGLPRARHTMTCEVLEETGSGGHDVRILGLGVH